MNPFHFIWALAGKNEILLRRSRYIKHPPQGSIPLKQKKE